MRIRSAIAAIAMLGLAACQTAQAPQTASGRPEVTIPNAQPARVKAALLNKMIDKGYRLVKDESFSVTFEKPTDNFAANFLLATPAGGPPVVRVTYTVAEIGSEVRVVADMALIQNAGMAYERRNDVSSGVESPKVQAFLEAVATETAGKASTKKTASR